MDVSMVSCIYDSPFSPSPTIIALPNSKCNWMLTFYDFDPGIILLVNRVAPGMPGRLTQQKKVVVCTWSHTVLATSYSQKQIFFTTCTMFLPKKHTLKFTQKLWLLSCHSCHCSGFWPSDVNFQLPSPGRILKASYRLPEGPSRTSSVSCRRATTHSTTKGHGT